MRNLMKLVAIVLFVTVATAANAQKFGHIDMQALVRIMPEYKAAEVEMNNFQKELEDVFQEMQQELDAKFAEFQALPEDASEVKKNAKLADVQGMQQKVQTYQQSAGVQAQQKQAELVQPVVEKAEKAIEEVAKEKGLIYVFDVGPKVILYKSNESIDVLPLVKAKLGIQ